MSEEALQIAEGKRKMRGKGERERYNHMNAEFQRIARRLFLNEQCKEIWKQKTKKKFCKAIILQLKKKNKIKKE